MKTIALALLGATMLAAMPAQAAIYVTRADFIAATGNLSTETFSGCGTATTVFSGSLSPTSGDCTGLQPDVTYSPANGGGLYIAAPDQSANPTTALGLNFQGGDPITVAFGGTLSAFGVDLFQNFGGGTQSGSDAAFTIDFRLAGADVGSFITPVASGTGSFFGFTGSDFDTVLIAQTNGFAVIDNVSFGGAVPEPATWAMMIGGIGLVGGSLRRRRAQARAVVRFA